MSFFKKFRANLNLRNPKNKNTKKSDGFGVQCLQYKIISEFTEEQVFNRNPRHFPEEHFTPKQHRKQQPKSLSENKVLWQLLAKENQQEEIRSDGEVKNVIWPSDSEIESQQEITQINETNTEQKTETKELNTQPVETHNESNFDEVKIEVRKPKVKSILKNFSGEMERGQGESSKSKVNFGFQRAEDGSYEPFEKIDDHVQDNNMYFSDQIQEDEEELYIVHKANHNLKNSITENEDEKPSQSDEEIYDTLNAVSTTSPIYNTFTHPKLNPTSLNGNAVESGHELNTFGYTRKLQNNIGISNQAANIFFDSNDEFDTANNKLDARQMVFEDNGSEMSA